MANNTGSTEVVNAHARQFTFAHGVRWRFHFSSDFNQIWEVDSFCQEKEVFFR